MPPPKETYQDISHPCKKQCALSDMTEYTPPLHFNHRQNLSPLPAPSTSHTLPTIVTSCTQIMNVFVSTEDPRRIPLHYLVVPENNGLIHKVFTRHSIFSQIAWPLLQKNQDYMQRPKWEHAPSLLHIRVS